MIFKRLSIIRTLFRSRLRRATTNTNILEKKTFSFSHTPDVFTGKEIPFQECCYGITPVKSNGVVNFNNKLYNSLTNGPLHPTQLNLFQHFYHKRLKHHCLFRAGYEGNNRSKKKNNSNKYGFSVAGGMLLLGFYILSAQNIKKIKSCLLSILFDEVLASGFNRNNFIANVVEKVAPAVVFLEIKGRNSLTGKSMTLSNGSGFIVRKDGLILTNAHVVANKTAVIVKLHDGRVYEGHVTARDPITDLATVKIEASNLTAISLGNSSAIRPAEWVIAMGSPLSLSNTVTCGIVSSVQRASKELGLRNKDMDYIQTDAVINFGNSGGPLVNLDGHAIGINTLKVTTGISFAIPSDYAQKFLDKAEALMRKGETDQSLLKQRYIGITMLTLTPHVIHDLESTGRMPLFEYEGGVFVYKVIPGTPAHIAGVKNGDIIIETNDRKVVSAADVYDAIERSEVLHLKIIRDEKVKMITMHTDESF